jgi:hypothetical protein
MFNTVAARIMGMKDDVRIMNGELAGTGRSVLETSLSCFMSIFERIQFQVSA